MALIMREHTGQIIITFLLISAGVVVVIGSEQYLVNCNFDGGFLNSGQSCRLSQQSGDQFDWTVRQGPTPSRSLHPRQDDPDRTGPNGGQGGSPYYAYIEASDPRRPRDQAWLSIGQVGYVGEVCLQFYYHALGSALGQLIVYQQSAGSTPPFGRTQIFRTNPNENMGDIWNRVSVKANLQNIQDEIVFVGIRGGTAQGIGWSGDIALDTITVSSGRCEGDGTVTTTTPPRQDTTTTPVPTTTASRQNEAPFPFVCDFEASLCGMFGVGAGAFDWNRQRGSTPTLGTGPVQARSGEWYMYIETSEPRRRGERFLIQTLPIPYQGNACLQFSYHMNGPDVERLVIYTVPSNLQIFDITGNQGSSWVDQAVNFRFQNAYESVVFEAIRGRDIRGDIAIDNINIDPRSCSIVTVTTQLPPTVFPPVPTTIPPTVIPPPTPPPTPPQGLQNLPWYCGFETNLCGMQQPINDRFDWARQAAGTPTVGTGPDGARSGSYYIYAEASDPRIPGDVALILTPMFNYDREICLEFYYHMYGTGIGILSVYITRLGVRVFEERNNQGNQWQFARVTVQGFTYGDQITFNATRGQSYTSDIAIDDINIRPGVCGGGPINPTPPIPTQPPTGFPPIGGSSFSCDVETVQPSVSNCRLRQDTFEDQLDWTRGSGRTPSGALYDRRVNNALYPVTGPQAARQGFYYLYIEASGRPRGLLARLLVEGNDVRRGGPACLRFHYSMNGFHTGELRVFSRQAGGNRIEKWTMAGDRGQGWQRAAVDINLNGISELGFEATTKGEFSGDIALDDIQVQPTTCTTTPSQYIFECNFETGDGSSTLCGMEQDRNDLFDWTLQKDNTPSQVTGPDRAFSGSYYVFIEASQPRVEGDFAILLTPELTRSGAMCLEFVYHMYGYHIDTLEVFIRESFQGDAVQWTQKGPKGNQWLQSRVNLPVNRSGARVGFRGVRGEEYSGDIAIDSIIIRPGRC